MDEFNGLFVLLYVHHNERKERYMMTITAIDNLNSCFYELDGMANMIADMAEKQVLLTQEELDYLSSSITRISIDIHNNTEIIYNYIRDESQSDIQES